MRKLFGRGVQFGGSSGASGLGRKPALGLSAVLLVLGLGFGANSWAVCEAEKEAYILGFMTEGIPDYTRTKQESTQYIEQQIASMFESFKANVLANGKA